MHERDKLSREWFHRFEVSRTPLRDGCCRGQPFCIQRRVSSVDARALSRKVSEVSVCKRSGAFLFSRLPVNSCRGRVLGPLVVSCPWCQAKPFEPEVLVVSLRSLQPWIITSQCSTHSMLRLAASALRISGCHDTSVQQCLVLAAKSLVRAWRANSGRSSPRGLPASACRCPTSPWRGTGSAPQNGLLKLEALFEACEV